MRFDKDIWKPDSREYNGNTLPAQDVQHLLPAARVFVALWLELLQDDRPPETRALRHLAVPDQLSELLTSFRLWKEDGRPTYRIRSAIGRLRRQQQANKCPFVGDHELRRLYDDAAEWLALVDELDQKKRRDLEKAARAKYGYPESTDPATALRQQLVVAAMGTLAQIRGEPEYKSALATYIKDKLSDPAATPRQFYSDCAGALRELLALVLDRGNSRESLAELPIRYLRGDNASHAGKPLPDRVSLIFGAFWGSDQTHEVFLPIGNIQLAVQGTIFPPGVSILDASTWQQCLGSFAGIPDANQLPSPSAAIKVEVQAYLNSGLAQEEDAPLDVFAARDVAVRAAQACLDAIFLYREHRIRLDFPCVVVATPRQQAAPGVPPVPAHRTVLQQRHEFRTRTNIGLPFLRPVPPTWADALHWYRLGNVINKDESGIVNLWTSAELLAANCHGTHGTGIDRVRNSVGLVASVFLFTEHQHYLASEAARYARSYGREALMNPPPHHPEDADLLRWWFDLCNANDEAQLCGPVFDMFPQLAVEALLVKDRLAAAPHRNWYDEHRAEILDDVSWIYSCRNDVVHDGRVRVSGASIARAIASEYVGTTIQATLSMRARGCTSSLAECFALANEKERTLRWHLEQGHVLEAMLTPYR